MIFWIIFLSFQALHKPAIGYGSKPRIEDSFPNGKVEEILGQVDERMVKLVEETCGESQLHAEVRRQNITAIWELVSYGADMYEQDCDGNTPFHLAILSDDQRVLQLFIKFRFDLNSRFAGGNTVLHFAAANGTERSVNTILMAGGMVDAANDEDDTPLFVALKLNRTSVFLALKTRGGNVFRVSPEGDNYLHKVVRMGDLSLTIFFIKQGLFIDQVNMKLETPLCIAVKNDYPVLVNVLLANGAIFARFGLRGESYLHIAVTSGSLRVLKTLLQHGTLVDATDADDDTALSLAIRKQDDNATRLLLKYRSNLEKRVERGLTYLHVAVMTSNLKSLRLLLENGLKPDTKNAQGSSAMVTAVERNFTEAMDVLKSYGSDVLQRMIGSDSKTLVHYAAARGVIGSLKWLLKNGLDVNALDSGRMTPLHTAASLNQMDAVKTLVDLGACVNCRNVNGWTALYLANVFSHQAMAAFLRSKGATI